MRLVTGLLFHCVKVGRFFGIAVRVHWSFWMLPVGLALASLSAGPLNAALIALLVLVFYAQGVVLHEYGHALTARFFGVRTQDIILTPIGGIARMEHMPEEPLHEIVIALAGPAVNIVFAAGLFAFLALTQQWPSAVMSSGDVLRLGQLSDFLWALVGLNVFMAGFNMLPAFPSDGGRVLRAFLSLFLSRLSATQVAVYSGALVALAMAAAGIYNGVIQLPFIALLFAFIGQMELMMVKRQAEMRRRPYRRPVWVTLSPDLELVAPEPDFSGYAWDEREMAWVEWRNGVAVQRCRMRIG